MLKKILVSLLLLSFFVAVYPARRTRAGTAGAASGTPVVRFRTAVEGYSRRKRPILSYRAGHGERRVLFFGVFHGDEPQGKDLLYGLMREIKKAPGLLDGRTVMLMPVVNPDGLARGTRVNANGVDLNRNFPSRDWTRRTYSRKFNPGTRKPEPETAAVLRVMKKFRPDAIVTIHAYLHCNNFDGPAADLALAMARHNHYPVKEYIGYATPGSFGSYAGKERNIPVITLELSRTAVSNSWARQKDALIAALRFEPGQFDRRGVFAAVRNHDVAGLESILLSGVAAGERDEAGWTPLHFAAFTGREDILRLLIQKGADANAASPLGLTPLHLAAQNNRTNTVRLLLDKGARPDARDAYGNTPLAEAGRNANLAPLVMLIGAGGDVNVKNAEGRPLIVDTARHGFARTLKMLVENGADVNARDADGRTALIEAAAQDQNQIVKFLIENGADLMARDRSGRTALKAARANGNRKTAALLTRAARLARERGTQDPAGASGSGK